MEKQTTITFDKGHDTGFYAELRKRVDNYFTEGKKSRHANGSMIFKTIFILTVFVGTYALILSGWFSPQVMLALAMVNGFFTALIGLNIAHDAIHGSYSSNKTVNKLLGYCFNVIGANDYVWSITHNIIHHTYTNIPEYDADIDQVPVIRVNPNQKLWSIHKFQHIYIFFLYALTSISWVFMKDYVKFFQPQIGGYDKSKLEVGELIKMIFFKIFYYTAFLVVPIMVIDLPRYYVLFGFVMLHFVEGLTLALVFQLAHIVEDTNFPVPNQEGVIANTWADHQMFTTADFACKNPLVNFLFGGLNFQIEHHLFPKVCHIHYTKLAPIVRETAQEFGLPYVEHPTFLGAIKSHLVTLKKFGRGAIEAS